MNNYETVFIITPVLSDVQVKEAVQKFKQLISDNGGKVVHEENWGLKKMAYPVQKKTTGFYQLLQFEAPGELINTIEINFKRDERIIRFLTVKLDKYAYEYAEKRKKRIATKKEEE